MRRLFFIQSNIDIYRFQYVNNFFLWLIFVDWLNFYWSTKSISKLWCPCIVTPKLSSSNCSSLILIFPTPPYQWLIWDYKKTDSKSIWKALDLVNCERLFDQKDINPQVIAFNETILNVFHNNIFHNKTYLPNKYIAVDDKDPVWMNETIKSKITAKNVLYKKYIQNGRFESYFVVELNKLISSAKALYYENFK